MAIEPGANVRMLVGGIVVENDVDDLTDRNLRLDGVQKSNEFLMTMALHIATDDRAVEDVERGEQRRGATTACNRVSRFRAGLLQQQAGWVRSRAWIWLFSSTDSTMAWAGGIV